MARKINLKGLFDTGLLSSSLEVGAENAQSNGIIAMFDNDPNLVTKFESDHDNKHVAVKITLSPPIQGKKFKVITNIKGALSNHGNILTFNASSGSLENTLTGGVASSIVTTENVYDFSVNGLHTLYLESRLPTSATHDLEIFNIDLFVIDEASPYEFNDSVLDTQGWNSSRYDGRQLQASEINEFTEGDTSYYGTPVLQNYSRNIYIGSRVIGMESGSIEDASLLNFPDFSYVTVHEFLTVNDDLSITKRSVRGDKPNTGMNNKKGFYQSWYDDFPVGSTIYLQLTDRKLQQSLKPTYTVFNNTGQLQKLLLVHKASDPEGKNHVALYNRDTDATTPNSFTFATGSYLELGSNFTIFNKNLLIDEFFSGSLVSGDILETTSNTEGGGGK